MTKEEHREIHKAKWHAEKRRTTCERSAANAGWFLWFGVWLHFFPHEIGTERPPYWVGTVRDLCLAHGLETGETTL